ncbi:MAG: efflux RND transporter periplasmic adaptor subunit [Sandaracinobacteroides sp.]
MIERSRRTIGAISSSGRSGWHRALPTRPARCAIGFLLAPALLAISACTREPPAPQPAETVPVRLHIVAEATSPTASFAAGTVRLRRETPLAFLNDGRVREVRVREGDLVGAGQLLAALDRTAIDSQAEATAARARQAASELQRQRKLEREGWVSTARVESAEASAKAAAADSSAARFSQRFATIVAPTGGVILARLAEPGQSLEAGTPVLVLGEFSSGFVVRVPLGAGRMADMQRGQIATVRFRDGAAPELTAKLIEMAGRADPQTGTFQAEFALPAHPALRSGLIADVILRTKQSGGLAIPATALFSARADEGFVWLYDRAGRKVESRMVRLGRVTDAGVEVFSGLQRGDLIVVGGVDRLIEGQQVRAVQSSARPPAPAAR